jgi:hypothetical protein
VSQSSNRLRQMPTHSVLAVLRGALAGMELAIEDAEKFRRKALQAQDELAGRIAPKRRRSARNEP